MLRQIVAGFLAVGLILGGCAQPASVPDEQEQTAAVERAEVNLILIYSLKEGVSVEDFENWVVNTDYPQMRGLARVADFRTYRAERLLMGEGAPSVEYVEAFAIPDLEGFIAEDMGGETVQSVMGTFMGFAAAPEFIVVSEVK